MPTGGSGHGGGGACMGGDADIWGCSAPWALGVTWHCIQGSEARPPASRGPHHYTLAAAD